MRALCVLVMACLAAVGGAVRGKARTSAGAAMLVRAVPHRHGLEVLGGILAAMFVTVVVVQVAY